MTIGGPGDVTGVSRGGRMTDLDKRIYRAAHCGGFLSNGDIDADHVAVFLRDDRIQSQRRLPRSRIARDQFKLPVPSRLIDFALNQEAKKNLY